VIREIRLGENLIEWLSESGPGDIKLFFYQERNKREISDNHLLKLKKGFFNVEKANSIFEKNHENVKEIYKS
jgi:hypothetical protein